MISQATFHPAPEVTAEFDRTTINKAGKSVRHLVVTVRAPQTPTSAEQPRDPLNLGLVIDASGSMSGRPLDAAKLAALDVIGALADGDHMSLVSFAEDAIQHAAAVCLADGGRTTLSRRVQGISCRGTTNLSAGWFSGCEAVAGRQATCEASERNHVVLLSDGHANKGEMDAAVLATHASELRRRGIVTSTVGVGCNYSPTQLQAIAEAGGGRMHDAELPEEIARIVMAELTDTLATALENVEVSLSLPAGMQAEFYGTAPCTMTATGCDVLVGSLIGGSTRRLVIKLTCPAGDPGDTLAVRATARWQNPGGSTTLAADIAVPELRFASGKACQEQPRDVATVRLVAERWQAHVYHRAMVLNQDGQGQAASDYVRREFQYLMRYCDGIVELREAMQSLEMFGESVRNRYSASSSKEMMLRAYKMHRGESDHRGREAVDFAALMEQEETLRRASGRRGP